MVGMIWLVNDTVNMIVAGSASLLTFFVARKVIRGQFRVGPPNSLAALVAGLAFLGLRRGGDGLIVALLIPYATLALALLFLSLWLRFIQSARSLGTYNRHPGRTSKRASPRNFNLIQGETVMTRRHEFGNGTSSQPAICYRPRSEGEAGQDYE
jgi:hypothetical protein